MKLLTKADLDKWVEAMVAEHVYVIAPVMQSGQPVLAKIERPDPIDFTPVITRNSFKDFLFPQTETVMIYTIKKNGVDVQPAGMEFPEMVVIGSRPCDAAGLAAMVPVFKWEGENDDLFLKRAERTTVVSLACVQADLSCFCTSVDLAPDTTEGSDVLLRETVDGNFSVEMVTEKGTALVEKWAQFFEERSEEHKPIASPMVVEKSDIQKILTWLSDPANYDDKAWVEHTAKCVGCGACTYVCPTCHCFDLTDEGNDRQGERRKNWDACQFDHFTGHASGHNPRPLQSQRWRNRFMCKFHFYPTKFESKGCVGCGRCIRVCYVGLDITEMMEKATAYADTQRA